MKTIQEHHKKELKELMQNAMNINPDASTITVAKDYCYDNGLFADPKIIEPIRFDVLLTPNN